MKTIKRLSVAFALACSATAVQAVPTYSGTYDLSDAGGDRGIWLAGGTEFSTVNPGSVFHVSGNKATLQGSVTNAANTGGFDFSVDFDFLCSSMVSATAAPRQVSVDNAGCGLTASQPTGGTVLGADVAGKTWDFWNWATGTYQLTGTGSLAGLVLDITQRPNDETKPFRVGLAADWDNPPPGFGGSGWFNVSATSCPNNNCFVDGIDFSNIGNGDFNFAMAADGTPPGTVPVPGALPLLGLGLLGLGYMRRRKA